MSQPPWFHIHAWAKRSRKGTRYQARTQRGTRSSRGLSPWSGGIQFHAGRVPDGGSQAPGEGTVSLGAIDPVSHAIEPFSPDGCGATTADWRTRSAARPAACQDGDQGQWRTLGTCAHQATELSLASLI